jgi:hypothetical protein
MYDETGRSGGERCGSCADRPNNRGTMTRRLIAAVPAALCLCFAATAAAAFEPDPGDWTASPAKGKGGTKANVAFFVDPDDATVAPTVSYAIRRRCKRAWSESVELAAVPVAGGGFTIRDRHRKGRAKVDVRLTGTFDSSFEAHGFVRATVKLRARRGRKPVTCKLPKLAWTAELTAPIEEEYVEEEPYDEEYEDEEEYYPEDEEYVPEDEEYVPEDETDPGE